MSALFKSNQSILLIVVFLIAFAPGCGRPDDNSENPAQHHHIRGLVMALEPARGRIIIAHEEIPHYMKAMTMPFTVKNSSMLLGIEVGDSVRGVVTAMKSGVWLDSLTVVAKMSSSETRH